MVRPVDKNDDFRVENEAYPGPGIIINSEFLNGLEAPDNSVLETINILENKKLGKKQINYRLKDWGVSRQRYWGCPYLWLMMKITTFILYQNQCFSKTA